MNKPTTAQRLKLRQTPIYRTPVMYQKWRDLLFLHWEIDKDYIQRTLPDGLYIDTWEEKAYIGITPFFLFDLKFPVLPKIPGVSDFLEVNVRTYVHDEKGTPGIWFYSLDANQWLAVEAAKQINLPYKEAFIEAERLEFIKYSILRKGYPETLRSQFNYKVMGDTFYAESETLEFFLTERYLLFYLSYRRLKSIQVYHMPYPLIKSELIKYDTNLFTLDNLNVSGEPVHAVMSPGVDVNIYSPEDVNKNYQ